MKIKRAIIGTFCLLCLVALFPGATIAQNQEGLGALAP